MNNNYKINNSFAFIFDRQSVNFHAKNNDYFGTLATIMELLNQDEIIENKKELKRILKSLKKDLIYLQKDFLIIKKPKPSK